MDKLCMWVSEEFTGKTIEGCSRKHLSKAEIDIAMARLNAELQPTICFLDAVVLRAPDGARVQPSQATLTIEGGLVGDRWSHGKAKPGDQVSMMNTDLAHMIANGQSVVLFGDNLFSRLDLSLSALPVGTHIRIGEALLEVSAEPHVPCGQFRARFGVAAFTLAAKNPRVRGVYLTVLEGGDICVGDPAIVVQRPTTS